MDSLEDMLKEFFSHIAKKDPNLINKLKTQKCFSISEAYWQFTLPNLFTFLQKINLLNENTPYDQFRRALYNSPINESIKRYNAEIQIEKNKSKVDHSIYILIWKSK